MNRRRLLRAGLLAAAAFAAGGHTPYGQWVVYRRKHLVIGCHKADPRTYELAREVVDLLDEHLPSSRPRVARGPDARRLASLLGTGQMEVATLGRADAVAMLDGTGQFVPYGAIPIRLLTPVADRLLVAVAGFPDRHAWLVTAALTGTGLAPAPAAAAPGKEDRDSASAPAPTAAAPEEGMANAGQEPGASDGAGRAGETIASAGKTSTAMGEAMQGGNDEGMQRKDGEGRELREEGESNTAGPAIPWHPGSLGFLSGAPEPKDD